MLVNVRVSSGGWLVLVKVVLAVARFTVGQRPSSIILKYFVDLTCCAKLVGFFTTFFLTKQQLSLLFFNLFSLFFSYFLEFVCRATNGNTKASRFQITAGRFVVRVGRRFVHVVGGSTRK